MLHLVTGTPGAKKTAFVVSKLDKIEINNKVNLAKNKQIYAENLPIMAKFADDFTYYESETGSGHSIKRELQILPDEYFSIFEQDFDELRPDDYYQRVIKFNEICERINEREGVQGFKGLLPVRTIYTNIKALKIDYTRALTYDWRTCPDGSIIVIDEVQLVKPYDNLKDRNNEIIQTLTIHRHRGFDFYFITQAPTLLHPTVKILIGLHWHLTVPFGWRTSVYQWGSVRDYPNTMINKINREKRFDFNPPARIFKLYKSTTINTHEKRFPWKIAVFVALAVLLFGFIIFKNLKTTSQSSLIYQHKTAASVVAATSAPHITSVTSATAQTGMPIQQMQQVQPAQQQGYFDPLHQAYITDVNLVPTSIVSFGGSCKAFNQHLQRVMISDKDCRNYLRDKSLLPKISQNQVMPSTATMSQTPPLPPNNPSNTPLSPVSAPAVTVASSPVQTKV